MLRTEWVRNKLREIGFTFVRQADRVTIWRNGTHRASLPRRDFMPESQARALLEQAGVTSDEIERFLASVRI